MLKKSNALRLTARLALVLPFAALLCAPSPGFAAPILGGDSLGAQGFAVLASSGVTNTAAGTTVTGDLGVSPAGPTPAAFPPGTLNGTLHVNDGPAGNARAALIAARAGLGALGSTADLSGQDLGNRTLIPGIYFSSDVTALLNGTLLLDAQGLSNAVWVFQLKTALTTGTGSVVQVTNTGGFDDQGVFWVIGSSATLGPGTTFEGNILALASISLDPGARITCGRALAETAAVTMAGFGGSPVARDNAVSIGCEDTAGEDASGTDASGYSGGLEIDDRGNVSFIIPGGGNGNGGHVPEPSTLLLLGSGLVGLSGVAWRRHRK